MAHLIDKDSLVSEIERQQRKLCILSQSNEVELRKNAAIQNGAYCSLLSFIDTLEVKEVDLEKVFNDEYSKFSNDVDAMDYGFPIDLAGYKDFAKHFFELGLKTKQE